MTESIYTITVSNYASDPRSVCLRIVVIAGAATGRRQLSGASRAGRAHRRRARRGEMPSCPQARLEGPSPRRMDVKGCYSCITWPVRRPPPSAGGSTGAFRLRLAPVLVEDISELPLSAEDWVARRDDLLRPMRFRRQADPAERLTRQPAHGAGVPSISTCPATR